LIAIKKECPGKLDESIEQETLSYMRVRLRLSPKYLLKIFTTT